MRAAAGVLTHILHVLWFIGRGVPAVIKDEDVWLWKALIHFVEKVFFLKWNEETRLMICSSKQS